MSPGVSNGDETPDSVGSINSYHHSPAPICTVAETSDCDSGFDDLSPLDSLRSLDHAKSWPLNSQRHVEAVRSALRSCSPGKKSLRFADSYGLPLVSVLHYKQYETVDEFRGGIMVNKLSASSPNWSTARNAMEDAWSWEDDIELSLSQTRSSDKPNARANSWDLPSTMKLRRNHKASRLTKPSGRRRDDDLSSTSSSSQPDTSCTHSETPLAAAAASSAKLRLEGNTPQASTLRDRLSRQQVCLEFVSFQDLVIFGSIVVANISFEKQVTVHYTLDNWATTSDLTASYVMGSTAQDGSSDRFSFSYVLPSSSSLSSDKPPRFEFAVCFKASGVEHWDSNGGSNFSIVPV